MGMNRAQVPKVGDEDLAVLSMATDAACRLTDNARKGMVYIGWKRESRCLLDQ